MGSKVHSMCDYDVLYLKRMFVYDSDNVRSIDASMCERDGGLPFEREKSFRDGSMKQFWNDFGTQGVPILGFGTICGVTCLDRTVRPSQNRSILRRFGTNLGKIDENSEKMCEIASRTCSRRITRETRAVRWTLADGGF